MFWSRGYVCYVFYSILYSSFFYPRCSVLCSILAVLSKMHCSQCSELHVLFEVDSSKHCIIWDILSLDIVPSLPLFPCKRSALLKLLTSHWWGNILPRQGWFMTLGYFFGGFLDNMTHILILLRYRFMECKTFCVANENNYSEE